MYIPKRYGESKVDTCPFCGNRATSMNKQKIPVCSAHKNSLLQDWKCACGAFLEPRTGKFGTFFTCINCGCISMKKAIEMNGTSATRDSKEVEAPRKEIVIRSDDPDYF